MRKSVPVGALALSAILALAVPARAVSFGFSCITNNNAGSCAIGEAQLSLNVTDAGGGNVLFTFGNSGPQAAVIAEVYFDDGVLQTMSQLTGSAGVAFAAGATPANLPGGNTLSPPFVATFAAQANNPKPTNGVGPGETLGVQFTLQPGGTFADVINQLNSGDLRVGIHVTSFANGFSEGFIAHPVPEPAALALFGVAAGALSALGSWRRRGPRRST